MIVKIFKTIELFLLGMAFSALLSFSGSALLGAGHGSALFLYIVLAPVIPGNKLPFESIGWLIWPIVGILIPWRHSTGVRAVVVILLLTNYISIAITLNLEGIKRASDTLMRAFPIAFPHLLVYLLVQYFIFAFIFGRWRIPACASVRRVKTN